MQEMKYFNEGNDCDICKNQLMTGRDGTVEDCRRRQNGLSCRFEERDIRTCPVCEHEVDREDMYFTKDAEQETEERATANTLMMTKLENIANDVKDIKRDYKETRAEVQDLHDRVLIVEQSLKSYHKRLDGMNLNIKTDQ